MICGISALALKTQAPTILKSEALNYYSVDKQSETTSKSPASGKLVGRCLGNKIWVSAEKAIVANASAVREWDSNGIVFGYNEKIEGHTAGEFGHNDFYPVVISACQNNPDLSGSDALRAMVLLDEIRGRLCEVFSLKSYKIDHTVHGAIASAATFGALLGATEE